MTYVLPSSQTIYCEDRFSILDSDELLVPFWPLFSRLLQQPVPTASALINLLETIVVIRQSAKIADYGFLKSFMESHVPESFYKQTWPQLVQLALSMPSLFPTHHLPILNEQFSSASFSRQQVACLVIHQFLCTLAAPTWQDGFQSFHIWYSTEQPHHQVVTAYLTSLFEYFRRLADDADGHKLVDFIPEEWAISYSLRSVELPSLGQQRFANRLKVLSIPEATTAPDVLGLPEGAAVISANKFVGFGRTGTQEETHVGASPECAPMVLITPPLKDNQVLVVKGAEAMITITGYGRDARCTGIVQQTPNKEAHRSQWSQRTMLFMDALELDLALTDGCFADLMPGNVKREIRKAYVAFNSVSGSDYSQSDICTGYWGCRTFGGNVEIKTLIQLAAASLAGRCLTFICSGPEQERFGSRIATFLRAVEQSQTDQTDRLVEVLLNLAPEQLGRGSALVFVQKQLDSWESKSL